MKIKLEIHTLGGMTCLSKKCIFRQECANHVSAGEYRSAGGFTPEIHEKNGSYFCDTADKGILDREDNGVALYGTFPDNYMELGTGEMLLRDLELKSYINYQI